MGGYVSDQGRVWGEVSKLQTRHGHDSPTSAARDVYENKAEEMQRREATFGLTSGYTDLGGTPFRVARDPLEGVRPMLDRWRRVAIG
jgi:hypothetical protein